MPPEDDEQEVSAIDPAVICGGIAMTIAALEMVKNRPMFSTWAEAALTFLRVAHDRKCGDNQIFAAYSAADRDDVEAFFAAAGCPCDE